MDKDFISIPVQKGAIPEICKGVLGVFPKDPEFKGSDVEWVVSILTAFLQNRYAEGAKNIAIEQAKINPGIIG